MAKKLVEEEKDIIAYSPTADEQKDIEFATSFQDECYTQSREERKRWRKSLQRYNLGRNLSEYEYIEDVHIGLTYDAVERYSISLPGREFGFRAKPVNTEDTTEAIKSSVILKRIWEAPDVMDGPSKMEVVKKSMALFGSCPVQLFWDTKKDKDGNIVKSDVGFVPLNIFNFYANKFYSDIQDCPEVGYISEMSLDNFQQQAKELGYKNWEKVQGVIPGSANSADDKTSDATDRLEMNGSSGGNKLKIVRIFEIQSDNEILTVALDENVVWLRKVPNKLGIKNIGLFRLQRNPVPNRLYGVTPVEKGGEIEDSIQRTFNQMVFNSLLVDNPSFTYNQLDQNIDPRTFVTAPGAGIPRGQDPNSITPITFNSHLNESLTLINSMTERWKRIVNIPDILAGIGKSAESATESSILDANTKANFNSIIDGMKGTFLHISTIIRKLYKEFGPESITVKIYEPNLIEDIANTPIGANKSLEVESSNDNFVLDRDVDITVEFTTQNKSILSRRLVEFLQLTGQDQLVPPSLKIQAYQQWLNLNDMTELSAAFNEVVGQKQASDVSLADQENAKMKNKQSLPPTPGASTAHTQRHVEFMRGAESDQDTDRILEQHIQGEISQQQNEQAGGSPEQQPGQEQAQKVAQPNEQTL